MTPTIEATSFGSLVLNGVRYTHDVVVRLDGTVAKRKKQLSKRIYGTSHTISLAEITWVYEPGAKHMVLGTGVFDSVRLSEEAAAFLAQSECQVTMVPHKALASTWNSLTEPAIGLFHLTC
jgi:hypothetical protein